MAVGSWITGSCQPQEDLVINHSLTHGKWPNQRMGIHSRHENGSFFFFMSFLFSWQLLDVADVRQHLNREFPLGNTHIWVHNVTHAFGATLPWRQALAPASPQRSTSSGSASGPLAPGAHQHISNQVMQGRRRALTLLLPDTRRGCPRKRVPVLIPRLRPSGTLQWHSAGHYHSLTDQHPAVFLKDLLAFYPNHTYSLTNISERRAKCPYATHLHVSYIVCRHSSSSSLTITWPHSAERLSTSSLFHQSKRQPTASPSYVNIPRVTASPLPFKLV